MAEPVKWAADLVRRLKETGTGDASLGVIRDAMTARFKDPDRVHLPPDDPARHLTAAEAVEALVRREHDAGRSGNSPTVLKARALAETGVWVEPAANARPRGVEDLLPPPPAERTLLPAPMVATTSNHVEDEEDDDEEDDGLNALTVAELRHLAADRGVAVSADARKADLVEAIRRKK